MRHVIAVVQWGFLAYFIALNAIYLGFSFIAEAFLNFGAAGAAVFVMILGALLSRLVSWAYGGRDPARIAVIATLCSSLLIFTRGESLFQMRFLVWYVLAPYCMVRGLAYVGSLVSTRRLRLQG